MGAAGRSRAVLQGHGLLRCPAVRVLGGVPALSEVPVAPAIRRVLAAGWACIALSAAFLFLSRPIGPGRGGGEILWWATLLMLARLFGMASFAIGCVAIDNRRWHQGMAMILSFYWHGTL